LDPLLSLLGQTPPGGVAGNLVDPGFYPLASGCTAAFWAPARGGIALVRTAPPVFSLDLGQTATGNRPRQHRESAPEVPPQGTARSGPAGQQVRAHG
jgi:hypothetical protein